MADVPDDSRQIARRASDVRDDSRRIACRAMWAAMVAAVAAGAGLIVGIIALVVG